MMRTVKSQMAATTELEAMRSLKGMLDAPFCAEELALDSVPGEAGKFIALLKQYACITPGFKFMIEYGPVTLEVLVRYKCMSMLS